MGMVGDNDLGRRIDSPTNLLPILMVWNARRLFRPPLMVGSTIVLCGLAFLFIGFSFSSAANWVSDYSTVNRATLHMAPVIVFYLFRLVHETVRV